ncbi:MAG: ABC transporter ATP-binding protein [Alphaproteobacteria bacterium]
MRSIQAGGRSHEAQALVLEHVEKRFGAVRALRDISFAVRRGEFLSLLGPSGSGKTTILRLIGGFEYPDAGRIILAGADVQRLPPYRRNIGVVFQGYALFPHMTVAENVEFPLRRRRIERAARRKRVAEVLELVGLGGLEMRLPAQLSGGQQQRVALARAIVFETDILLLDEPLGALDKQLRDRMQREIRALQAELRITTVFVTHDQTEAMAMSDRIAVIDRGAIEQIDEPEALYERPATPFVAGFIGDSNLLPCKPVGRTSGRVVLELAEGVFVEAPERQASGAEMRLLLRPERIKLAPAAARGDGNVVLGTIAARAYLGEATLYMVSAGALTFTVRQPRDGAGGRYAIGEAVALQWDWDDGVIIG